MRTLLMIVMGIALAVAFDAIAVILSRRGARAIDGARLFVSIWLGIVVVDFGFGVAAGYSVVLELAVHALIFVAPAGFALFLARRRGAQPDAPD